MLLERHHRGVLCWPKAVLDTLVPDTTLADTLSQSARFSALGLPVFVLVGNRRFVQATSPICKWRLVVAFSNRGLPVQFMQLESIQHRK